MGTKVKRLIDIPFRRGDVVKYVGKDSMWKGEHIIGDQVHYGDGYYEYSTTKGAWIPHSHFILIRGADQESLSELHASETEFGE